MSPDYSFRHSEELRHRPRGCPLGSWLALVLGLGYLAAPAATSSRTEQVLPGLTLVKGSVNPAVFERNGRKL